MNKFASLGLRLDLSNEVMVPHWNRAWAFVGHAKAGAFLAAPSNTKTFRSWDKIFVPWMQLEHSAREIIKTELNRRQGRRRRQ